LKSTDKDAFESVGKGNKKPTIEILDPSMDYQIKLFEYIMKPSFRIYVTLKNNKILEELIQAFESETYFYTPSLGTSNCLANIEYIGKINPENPTEETIETNSPIVDSSMLTKLPEGNIVTEKITEGFETFSGQRGFTHRKSTGFISYIYTTDTEPIEVDLDSNNSVQYVKKTDSFVSFY